MSEFEDWLRKGLGRAAVHLMTHDSKPYREAIVHACTYNLAYDRQCEETRPQYLIDLIQLSRDEDFYRDAILDAIRTAQQVEEDDHDNRFAIGQIYGIATHFAKQDEEIRRAMYATFQRLGFANAGLECAEQLIKLDGVPGLVSASETVDQIDADERPWMFGEMLKTLDQHHGKHPLPHTLIPFAAEREAYQARPRSPGTPRMSYAEVKARVLAQGRKAGMLLWTKRATDEEVRCLADDLLAETDPDRLYGFLRMFHLQQFPRDPARLFELASSEDAGISLAARHALANNSHPGIRPWHSQSPTTRKCRGSP